MADRGTLGGQTYALPTVQPVAPTPAPQPYDDGVKAMEGLEFVKGETEGYYRKVAALKSFMQDAHANYGVDVRVPDLSKPESIKLHQIYNDAITDILHTGNKLKQGATLNMMERNRGDMYANGYDPTEQSAAERRPGTEVFSHSLEGGIREINDKLQMASQTREEHQQKEQIYADAIKHYDDLIAQYPDRKSYYEYQKSGLVKPTKGDWRPTAPPRDWNERRWGKQVENSGNFLKDITQIEKGTSDSYKLDESVLNPKTGNPLYVSTSYQNANWGADPTTGKTRELKYWGHDPESGQTFAFFKDGTSTEITGQNPVSITRGVLSDNSSRFGATGEHLDEYVKENGILKRDGSADFNHPLLSQGVDEKGNAIEENIRTSRKTEQAGSTIKKKQTIFKGSLEEWDKNAPNGAWYHDPKTEIQLGPNSGATVAKIRKLSNGLLALDNAEKIIPLPKSGKPTKAYTNAVAKFKKDGVTPAEMADLLIKAGKAHEQVELPKPTTGTEVVTSKATTQEEFNKTWATLKPGEKLIGPNGVEYTKK